MGGFLFSQEIDHPHSIHHAFIENKGQWDNQILFKSKFDGGNLWIQQNKFLFHFQDYSEINDAHIGKRKIENPQFKQAVVHLNFLESNKVEHITKVNPTESYYNFFIGNDSAKWASNVKGYTEAVLSNFYDGIDLKLIENEEELKYEFHIQPHVSPSIIKLEFNGQKQIKIDEVGNLVIETELGRLIEKKPYSYQIINGKIKEIKSSFILNGKIISFLLSDYDANYQLIIDPLLVFATYSKSTTDNFGMTATYAHNGEAYSGGTIFGNTYPTPDIGAFDISSNFTVLKGSQGITDVFISKYSKEGKKMIWTSFIGGGDNTQGTETVHSLIADELDNLYLYGATSSTDFPIKNGFQTVHGGGKSGLNFSSNGVYHLNQGTDIYVSKLSANGHNLLGSTYVGGSDNDGVNYNNLNLTYDSLMTNYGDNSRGEIMLDQNGNCIIASSTHSSNFPVKDAFQPTNNGRQDGVIFKLTSDLSSMIWSSYFGGTSNDVCYSVKVDSSFNIVFAGGTTSVDLTKTSGTWMSSYNGGVTDGFVGKISSDGQKLKHVSYVGTSDYDQVFFVEIDRNDNVFLLGQSEGGGFPVVNSNFVNPNSSQFICKLDSSLTTAIHSTVFGNGLSLANISPSAFLVDVCGNMYVSGWGGNLFGNISLNNMPISTNAFQSTPPNGYDFYLMVVDKSFDHLIYGTYIGGPQSQEHVDGGTSRFDRNGVVYQSVCGGCGKHSDFPTTAGAWSNLNLSDNCNNVLFKFDFGVIPEAKVTVSQNVLCLGDSLKFENNSTISDSYLWNFGRGVTDTTSTQFSPTIKYTQSGLYNVLLTVSDSICQLTDSAFVKVTIFDSIQLKVQCDTQLPLCTPKEITLTAKNNNSGKYFLCSSTGSFKDTLLYSKTDSTYRFIPERNGYYFIKVGNSACAKIDSIFIETISSYLSINGNSKICKFDSSDIQVVNSNSQINFQYTWSQDSVIVTPTNLSDIKVNPKVSQFIVLEIDNLNGCVFKDSIYILVSTIDSTLVNATVSDDYIPIGEKVTLKGKPDGYSYNWSPNVDQPNSQQSTVKPLESIFYVLSVSDGICSKKDSVFVKVFPFVCDDPSIFVPNAFSPNGDGNNDVLVVRGKMIKEMTFRIFDRWGELIFETHERGLGWDGTFKGKKMDPDVYDYYLKVTCIDDVESIVKGNITLLK